MSEAEDKSASGAQTVRRALALLRLIACESLPEPELANYLGLGHRLASLE